MLLIGAGGTGQSKLAVHLIGGGGGGLFLLLLFLIIHRSKAVLPKARRQKSSELFSSFCWAGS